jgi:putative sterol carrier protein
MKYWSDPAQPITAFMKLFSKTTQDEDLRKSMLGLNQLILFDYTQDGPDCAIWLDARNNQLSYGPGKPPGEPDLTLSTGADEAHLSWANKLNAVQAITRGKIKVRGSAAALLKLAPKSKKTAEYYTEALKELGWEDKLDMK